MQGSTYVVCQTCAYLRVYASGQMNSSTAPRVCPACGGSLAVHDREERFPPTYVARAALELHAKPPL